MENLNETYLDIMSKNYKIESDDPIERYIVPLDAIIETKSYKDLMKKGNQKYKNLPFFIKVFYTEELGQSIC